MKKYRKIITLFLVIAISITIIIAYKAYNEEHIDVAKQHPDYEQTIATFMNSFTLNDTLSHQKYNNKIIKLALQRNNYELKRVDSVTSWIYVPATKTMSVSIFLSKQQADKINNINDLIIKAIYNGFIPYDKDFEVAGEIKLSSGVIVQ